MDVSTELLRWAEIDLKALADNVRALRRHLRPGTRLMGIVKKNAYGHGAVPVARVGLYPPAQIILVCIP